MFYIFNDLTIMIY